MKTTQAYQTYRELNLDLLRDSEDARMYLELALEEYGEDQDTEAFLLAIKNVAEAQGGLSRLARLTHLNRGNLYKALSPNGNPRLDTVGTILHGLGFRLSVAHREGEEIATKRTKNTSATSGRRS